MLAAVPIAASTDYEAGFAVLEGQENVSVVVCDSTTQTDQQDLRDSVAAASAARRERIAVVGGAASETVTNLISRAAALNSERVVLVAPGGFAVVHSGWKGTIARISAKACQALCDAAGCDASDVSAYIGPHILADEYEVSQELMDRFAFEFSCIDASASRMLNLSAAICEALVDAGVDADNIVDTQLSTVRQNDRFYSYRNENGTCGRHAAIGVML